MKFVADRPAMVLGKNLVLAELHLGLEYALRKKGVMMPPLHRRTAAELNELMKETKTDSLIVLGDTKHEIYGMEQRELRTIQEFFSLLKCGRVLLVKGNHDGDLEKLEGRVEGKDLKVAPAEGTVVKIGKTSFGLVHGHAWPSQDVLMADILLMAHNHPQIEFYSNGYRWVEQAWVVGNLRNSKEHGTRREQRVVIFPCFNPLSGGKAVNKMDVGLGPLLKNGLVDLANAQAFLLNGVSLGKIKGLKKFALVEED